MRTPVLGLLIASWLLSADAAISNETASVAGRFYEMRGVKVYVETYGSGTPILFLHGGLAFFDNSFGPQRDYFSSFRRVIGFDQRGHGHSPDNAEPFSYRQMAQDTAALIELLGVGPIDIVGHSDGANVGLHGSLVKVGPSGAASELHPLSGNQLPGVRHRPASLRWGKGNSQRVLRA